MSGFYLSLGVGGTRADALAPAASALRRLQKTADAVLTRQSTPRTIPLSLSSLPTAREVRQLSPFSSAMTSADPPSSHAALLELGGHISGDSQASNCAAVRSLTRPAFPPAASDSVPRPGPRPPQAPKAALVTPPASLQKAKKSKKRPMEEITLDSSEDEEDGVDEVERLRARVAQLEREQALLKGGGKVKKAKLSGQVKAKEEKKGQAGRGAKERRVVIEVD